MIKQILNNDDKQKIARIILEALPEWFGIPEATEEYIVRVLNSCFLLLSSMAKRQVFYV